VKQQRAVPVLYLDLDGTVRHGKDELGHFVNKPDDVVIFPEALTLMRRWKDGGGRIVGVSNQGGIALGYITEDWCAHIMLHTNELADRLFDKIVWCQHHPAAAHPEYARCWCRKPSPGMLFEGAHSLSNRYRNEFYPPYMALMVGDRYEDRECARIANVDFQEASEWRASAAKEST
jgi:D-glycero-D-manno-heptose 1,7-bisphosphate phosphatase